MTISEAQKKVIDIAKSQVGVKEGANNWNPYAADPRMTQYYGCNMQNQPWCNIFSDWIFVEAFSLSVGKAMVYDGSPSCAVSAQHFKDNGAWCDMPHLGDQIFLIVNDGINHIGTVVGITNEYVDTVEGNYSDKVSMVRRNKRSSDIAGYGVPNWSLVVDEPDDPDEKTGLLVDGECGEETWAALFARLPNPKDMPIVKRGSKGWAVSLCQSILDYLNANLGIDGDCGRLTENAIREFQEGKL